MILQQANKALLRQVKATEFPLMDDFTYCARIVQQGNTYQPETLPQKAIVIVNPNGVAIRVFTCDNFKFAVDTASLMVQHLNGEVIDGTGVMPMPNKG